MASSHLVTTTATPTLCHHCHRLIITGISEGLKTQADPTQINPQQELQALIQGKETYTFTPAGELVLRDASRISGGLEGVTLMQHSCGKQISHIPPF